MHYDAIILGTGQAGPALAGDFISNGQKVAIIEKGHYGGTCVNTGCTPTKAYVASARRAYIAKSSSNMGISITGTVKVDLPAIKARKDKMVETSRDGLKSFLEDNDGIDVYNGKGVFTGPNEIEVNEEKISADKIFLNVGGRPHIPEGFEGVDYLTNESMLELEEIPDHLIVVGGGYIGLEFGQMFRRFGSRVTIIEQSARLMDKEDTEVSKTIAEVFKSEGINIRLNAECISASIVNGKIVATLDCDETPRKVEGTHLLLATGRAPNTDNLGLEQAGVEINDEGYIKVNKTLKTNQSHIWAMGDCNGEGAFTHTAYNDYQIVASQLFGDGSRTLSNRHMCYAAFIDPPLARVGLSEAQVREQGIKAKVAYRPMERVARAKEKGETQGFLKILIDAKTDHLLGATFLGTGADEYIHSIIDLMYAGAPYTVIRDAMHIHPTVSELIPTMLESLEDLL